MSKIVKIVKNCQKLTKLSKIFKNCQISKNCQKMSKLSKIVKIFKIVKIIKNCRKMSKIFKIVKKFQNCQKFSKLSKIVKMLVRSCFLITVIKCLKGHWSLGSLFNVKKQKVAQSLSHSVREWVTRSPIELFWTAKKWRMDGLLGLEIVLVSKMTNIRYLEVNCINLVENLNFG